MMSDSETTPKIDEAQSLIASLIIDWQDQSSYCYVQPIRNDIYGIMHDKGLIVYTIKHTKKAGYYYEFEHIYRWDSFRILSFYRYGVGEQKQSYFSFVLETSGEREVFTQLSKIDMIKTLQANAIVQSRSKSFIVPMINQMLKDPEQQIEELDVVNYLGFTAKGWRMPDKYQMVCHNEFRREIEQRISNMIHRTRWVVHETKWPFPDMFLTNGIGPVAVFCMNELYSLTKIRNKDPLFAYIMIAPYLYALRSKYDLLPFVAMGGPGGLGKTALFKYGSAKIWDHVKGVMGSTVMGSRPRVEGTLTASTLPICLDDCSDLKDFVIGIIKRYTTVEDTVKKLNQDQTMKMNAPYCTPCYLTYNAYPVLFDDPALRQRIFNRRIAEDDFSKDENWLEFYNFIPDGLIGRYIYQYTKDWTARTLLDRLEKYKFHYLLQFLKGRSKDLCRLMLLGADLFKEIFGIELDMRSLPADLRESIKAGNEDIISLVQVMIEERKNFRSFEHRGYSHENPQHWVKHQVIEKEYHNEKGFLITTDNTIDLAKRLGRKPKDLSLPTLNSILSTEYKTSYTSFKHKKSKKSVRGIWISEKEFEESIHEDEENMKAEIEFGDEYESEFEIPLEFEKE